MANQYTLKRISNKYLSTSNSNACRTSNGHLTFYEFSILHPYKLSYHLIIQLFPSKTFFDSISHFQVLNWTHPIYSIKVTNLTIKIRICNLTPFGFTIKISRDSPVDYLTFTRVPVCHALVASPSFDILVAKQSQPFPKISTISSFTSFHVPLS